MTDWRVQAACLPEDPEIFFPISTKHEEAAPALAVCAECPVVRECRRQALGDPINHQHGVWGGLTAQDRKRLIRSRQRAAVKARARAQA